MQVNVERWHALTIAQQLGNLGSEFSRARQWKGKNDEYFFTELDRFIAYISAMMTDPKWQNHRKKELCRLKESTLECLTGNDLQALTSLQAYFDQFALLARR